MKKAKILLLTGVVLMTASCNPVRRGMEGEWADDQGRGFQLSKGNMAASIRQPEMQYSRWQYRHKKLILQGKHFHDNTVEAFSDTLRVEFLSANSIVLRNNTGARKYKRI